MDEAVARRPIQNLHCIVLRDPSSQNLARLVPIDQENERDTNRFEKEVATCRGLSAGGRTRQLGDFGWCYIQLNCLVYASTRPVGKC